MLNEPLRESVDAPERKPFEVSGTRLRLRPPLAPFGGRLGLAVLLLAAALAWKLWPAVRPWLAAEETRGGHLHVGDGDSLALDGVRFRLLGIDAPELHQTCTRAGEIHPCGREARDHLLRLIAGREVVCAWSHLDRYGRRLGRCRAGSTDLNAEMVRGGWAVAYGGYEREEAEAEAAGRGLWSGDFVRPEDWRREERARRDSGGFGDWLANLWR